MFNSILYKFTQLYEYALFLVENFRAEMNHFIMGVSELVENQFRVGMLIDDTDISRLMVFS